MFRVSGEDVRGGGGDLHGVLGALPHLLHPLLPLSSDHPQGVDLQCLPGGAYNEHTFCTLFVLFVHTFPAESADGPIGKSSSCVE